MTPFFAALLIAVLLAFVAWIVASPFRRREPAAAGVGDSDQRRGLESARESKYAEIRDNETDYATGKLSDRDYRALENGLRAEAVEILRQLDSLPAPDGVENH
jgi:hypothetical protein